jgi:two-component system sensor histidine kinase YesM
MKKQGKVRELRVKMVSLLVFGWILPIVILSSIVYSVMSVRLDGQLKENVTSSATKVIENIDLQLDMLMNSSRNATYMDVVSEGYEDYLEDGDAQKLYDTMTVYIAQQYRYNKNTDATILFFIDYPELFYSTYSAGDAYDKVQKFQNEYMDEALAISEELGTYIHLASIEDSLYLMRNLVDEDYKRFAMIIMDINKEYLFKSLESIWGYEDAAVFIEGKKIFGFDDIPEKIDLSTKTKAPRYIKSGNKYYVYHVDKVENQTVSYVIALDNAKIRAQFEAVYSILALLVLSIVPLSVAVFRFFNNTITEPVTELVVAAQNISNKEYGYTIETETNSKEFVYLNNAFNNMSNELKRQFDQIYLEEVAIRDANIKALQSQINPHFINNTLEIINWEARMNGNYKVSNMIEALSTMLNATLNRKNVQTISLQEELEYVDAYLYIIAGRMGNRLFVEKQIDESLLHESVPRLIAQPVIENAVEHGVKLSGQGRILIKIYKEEPYMYIEIRNTGRMSEEDEANVRKILSPENKEPFYRSVSIGINNVNKRLKLMYGDECGLTIFNDGDETVNLLKFKSEGGEA